MSRKCLHEKLLYREVEYASEEFTSAFEIRENTNNSDQIHGFQQRLEGHTPSEYIALFQVSQVSRQA